MALFSETTFTDSFDFSELDRTVASTIRLAVQDPTALYLFFQRYSHFNGYASAVISRLVSSIGLSRYLFANCELLVTEEADRGMEIAAQVMAAAADEGTNDTPVHRALAQLTLKTVGNYAGVSTDERNEFAKIPTWLHDIIDAVVSGYQGTPGDIASLMRGMGFHIASEMLGDREYSLIDKIICHDNKGIGFDRYLKKEATPVKMHGHRYTAWCWILIHSRHEGSGAEVEHSEFALNAVNMAVRYRPESEQQMMSWVKEGFATFTELQQRLFKEIAQECQELLENSKPEQSIPSQFHSRALM